MALRVVEWSTGTVGKHAIAGILARPELELVGCWVSSEEKHGRDVGEICGGDPLGVTATMDKDELIALKPDCVVHTAMTDADPFAALGLFEELLAAGINVVSSGPVFLQHPQRDHPGGDDRLAAARRPSAEAPPSTSTASTRASPTTCCRWC